MTEYSNPNEQIVLNFNAILDNKRQALDELQIATAEAINISKNYHARKNRAWLQTDFKKLGLTNDKQRTAYVEETCKNLKFNMEKANARVDKIKREIYYFDQVLEIQKVIFEKEI